MPRDDLSIDFVKKNMPPIESLDPALILDDWTNRVSNLPEEIKFIQDEITEKDRQVAECLKLIEERDARIQRWIKANGSHTQNPREESFRQVIRDNYNKAEQLSDEKLALTQRLQTIIDKHIRHLDVQIKMLYDRNEPGFTDPDEVPSLLRASAANTSAPSVRAINPSANPVTAALSPLANPSNPLAPKGTNPQVRGIQTTNHISSSAPASPAANILKRGVRESSAGPAIGSLQRGPRSALGLNTAPNPSSGLARHSSLGPGTPKGHTATGVQRAGSAGPRTGVKGAVATGRKSTPSGSISGRTMKKPPPGGVNKSGLNRVRKTVKNSPSSNADSELSDADSSIASGDESDGPRTGGRGTPAARSSGAGSNGANGSGSGSGPSLHPSHSQHPHHHEGPPGSSGGGGGGAPRTKREHDEDHSYVEEDEGSDDKKYCICQKVSFGDMIACDNEDCPYEWFHWTCVGLKSEPQGGKWFCPVCTASMKKVK